MQGHQTKQREKDTISLNYSSICYIGSRIGWIGGVDEGNLQVIDVEVIMENCLIIILLRYILTSSDYGVCNSHYIVHL